MRRWTREWRAIACPGVGDPGSAPGDTNGGAGGETPRLASSSYPLWQVQAFDAAWLDALQHLTTNYQCEQFFAGGGENPMALLEKTTYRFLDLGAPTVGADGTASVAGAMTVDPTDVFINTSGPLFDQSVFVPSTQQFVYFSIGGLSGADFGALLLLHELGHQEGLFGPDTGPNVPAGTNAQYTQQVLDNCFTSLGGGLYK